MITVDWFRGKKVTVMGLGLHGGGLGIAKWLMRHGAKVTVTDMKDAHALRTPVDRLERAYRKELRDRGSRAVKKVTYVLGRHRERDFTEADLVIQNPGVPRDNPFIALAKRSGARIETDISIFFMLCPFPITAISGTKGKTTTTALLADICTRHDRRTMVGGNIRISPMEGLDRLLWLAGKEKTAAPPVVLELSSWQLEGLKPHRISPHIGVVTNVMRDHLNRYDGMDDYAEAKEITVGYQQEGDVAVLNADDARVRKMAVAKKGREVVWFSRRRLPAGKNGCFAKGRHIVAVFGKSEERILPLDDVRLEGDHNVMNVLAACTTALVMGVPAGTIREAVSSFTGVYGRMEHVATRKGVLFVNDTTATTPDASIAAIRTYASQGKGIILLGGGADKELQFGEWAKEIGRSVRHLVLFEGTAQEKIESALLKNRVNVPYVPAGSMKEAMKEALRHARKGDVVLLSPGAASFGIFVNEFDRGDQFVGAVKRMK